MHRLATARGKAYALDCLGYLGVAAAMVPLGLLIRDADWVQQPAAVHALSAVPPVIATMLAARQESASGSTWGKRRLGLTVAEDGAGVGDGNGAGPGPPTFARALLRNTLKIAVPWQIGHTVAVGAAFGGFEDGDPVTMVAGGLSYVVIGVLVAGVVLGEGRAVHDRLTGTRVRAA